MTGAAVQTPILMYHSVSDTASPSFSRYSVSPADFERQMVMVAQSERQSMTVAAYAARLRRGVVTPHAVVLTFDDAFADFATNALPILNAYGLSASLFVPTSFVGHTSSWLGPGQERLQPLLTWDQLRAIRDAGIEIGAHAHTHVELDRVPQERVLSEVNRPKAILETELDVEVTSFAYPFGYHNRMVRRALRAGGYRAACQVGHRRSTGSDDPFALCRLIVPGALKDEGFRALLSSRDSTGQRIVRRTREAGATLLRRLKAPRPEHGG